MRDLKKYIRKKNEYEIFLINLQECFDDARHNIKEPQLKKWLKQLSCNIDKVLETENTVKNWSNLKLEKELEKLFDKEEE